MTSPVNSSGLLQVDNDGGGGVTLVAPFTFTAGRTAVFTLGHYAVGQQIDTVTIGGTLASLDVARNKFGSFENSVRVYRAVNMAGGTNEIVITYTGGTDNYLSGSVEEWDVLLTPDPGTANSAESFSNTPSVSTAATTAAEPAIVYALVGPGNEGSAQGFAGPTGWNAVWTEQDASLHVAGRAAWIEEAAAGVKTAAFTRSAANPWGAAIIAYSISPIVEPQVARPDADVSDGVWTPSTGTDNYAVLDETPLSDTDYSSTDSNSTLRVGLSALSTPDSGAQTVRFRAGGSPAKKLIVRLVEGASTVRGSLTVDPLTAAVAAYSFNPSGITDFADLDIEAEVQDATTPPTLQVTWGAAGTAASGTTSAAPSYPTGISAATSKIYCAVTGRSNTAGTAPTMPAGWTNIGDFEGGTGTWGVDAGTRRVTIFRKDTVTGSETGTVTVSLSGTTANTLRATIFRVEVPSGYGISEAFASGADTSSDTAFSATASSNISFQANDLLLIAVAQAIDSATQSAQSITATGITFGTRTNRASTAVTNGNDHRHIIDTVPVSSGSGTVAPTYSYTASAAASGPVGFLRLRAVEPTEFARLTGVEFEVPAGPAGPSASLSVTEENDTLSATASTSFAASLTVTEENDTLSSAATVALAAALTVTEQGDTLSSTATGALVASLSVTEQDDTLSSTATSVVVRQADLAITEQNDTLSSTATVSLVASLSVTEQNDSLASTAAGALAASLTATEQPDTLSSTAAGALAASLNVTEQPDTLSSTATVALVATLSVTEQNDSLASTAAASLVATLSVTEQNDTLSSTATGPGALIADLSITEQNDTLSATALVGRTAALSVTEQPDTLSSTAAGALAASLAVTEQGDSLVGTANVALAASLSVTEQSDTLSSTAVGAIEAALAVIEEGDILVADAAVQATVVLSIVEANDALVSTVSTLVGGGATADEIWNYVLSNGLTAGETLAQALAAAQNCCGGP